MKTTLKIFLNDLIEYAGMFPPAKLPFQEAFQNFLNYRSEKHHWILSRFICPVASFDVLCDALTSEQNLNQPVRISALGGSLVPNYSSTDEFQSEFALLKELENAHPVGLCIETFEAKLSQDLVLTTIMNENHDELSKEQTPFSQAIIQTLSNRPVQLRKILFELPFDGNHISIPVVRQMIREFAKVNSVISTQNVKVGLKVRCGGSENIIATTPLIEIVQECALQRVPFKATAGLHHPVFSLKRTEKYGFMSLFWACAYCFANPQASIDQISQVLTESNVQNFKFEVDESYWKSNISINSKQIEESRRLFLSFGSCSFDEPIQDLINAGYLDK